MYLDFYKFKEFPFALSCDERFFYESEIHAEALANMIYTIQQRKGMVLITGEVGAGKTFLGNVLQSRLGSSCLTVHIQNPPQSGKQLIKAISSRIGINVSSTADKITILEELEQYLIRLHYRNRLVALVLDEAQGLTPASLEEIRLLWNWEIEGHRLIQIVLIGQPELRQKLQSPRWEPLRQRIVLSYHLGRLSPEDVEKYIDHRIRVAADEGCLASFTPAAKAEVRAATDGIPRSINILCDNALLVGYAKGVHIIDRAIIAEVIKDMTCWQIKSSPVSYELNDRMDFAE